MHKLAPPAFSSARPTICAPRTRDDVWTVIFEIGLWPGLSVAAVIDRFEIETGTNR